MTRIAIAQIAMCWTTAENLVAIERAMHAARARGAELCAFAELALTGFHREIAREAVPQTLARAVERVQALAAELNLAVALGAPTFGAPGAIYNTHLLIDETGRLAAEVPMTCPLLPYQSFRGSPG